MLEKEALQGLLVADWASVSSAGAPEARAVSGGGGAATLLHANSVCRDPSSSLVCAGYDDGSARVFRYPAHSPGAEFVAMSMHLTGSVLTTFTAPTAGAAARLVTVGENDGTLLVWEIRA